MAIETVNGRKAAVFETDNGRIVCPLDPNADLSNQKLPARPSGDSPVIVPSRDGVGKFVVGNEKGTGQEG